MKARLIAMTQPVIRHEQEDRALTADELIAYCARVSNPGNQHNHETAPKLLAYCIRNGHWSVFEQAGFTVEVETSRAIAAQILRHRSFCFQEFSQRYAEVQSVEPIELRTQDPKNRQASGEAFDLPFSSVHFYSCSSSEAVRAVTKICQDTYRSLVDAGVSKETARMILPLCTRTTLYITGNIRSWIHYFDQRCSPHAQKEHRLLAEMIRDDIFRPNFPAVSAALEARQ